MKRVRIKLHPAGAIGLLFAFLLMDSHFVLSAVFSLVIHESAHVLVMYLSDIKNCTIELTPFGGMVDARDFDMHPPWKRALSAIAGIIASAASAWICWKFAPRTVFWKAFFHANLSLAFLNSLPAWPLDGARVITALAGCAGCENSVRKMMTCFTIVIGTGFVVLGLYGAWHGIINASLLFIGPYLCYAARAENVTDKIRKIEYAGNKLDHQVLMPVSVWAGASNKIEEQFGTFMSRMQHGRYHILMHMDQENGSILKCWTEKEIINHLLRNGRN